MKYIIILGDGMSDYPIAELKEKTPLQFAKKPHMDRFAREGIMGMVQNVPEGMPPGSDVANISVMGYDPRKYYTGRSPLEAVSMGVPLSENDVAFRCNLVTLSDDEPYQFKTMLDYSSDEISTEEAKELILTINETLGTEEFEFYPGVSYRHLLVWRNGKDKFELTPPHDISDGKITNFLPQGNESEKLLTLMLNSVDILKNHPVNMARVARGLKPATSIWLWGQGKKPAFKPFSEEYGLKGAVISAVDLTKGLGLCAEMLSIDVPGTTGNIHTNFAGKAQAALKVLADGTDFVYVHIEAPDEAGHRGELDTKIKAIEEIDEKVIGPMLAGLEKYDDYKIMVLPDHPTPIALKTHTSDPVPFVIYQKTKPQPIKERIYSENDASSAEKNISHGYKLMEYFLFGKE